MSFGGVGFGFLYLGGAFLEVDLDGGGFVPTLLVLLQLAGLVASGVAGEGDGGGGGGGGGAAGDDCGSMLGSPAPAVDGGSMLEALGGCGGELGLELYANDVVTSGHENVMYFLGQQIQVWMPCPSYVSPLPPSISRSRSS